MPHVGASCLDTSFRNEHQQHRSHCDYGSRGCESFTYSNECWNLAEARACIRAFLDKGYNGKRRIQRAPAAGGVRGATGRTNH